MVKKETKTISPSKAVAAKTIFEAFKILKNEGGDLPGKEVIDRIRQNVNFTDWEKEVYEKTGYVRWEAILHFYTVDCAKAGFMRKSKGVWYLTPEGEQAMKLGDVGLLEAASEAYKKWDAKRKAEVKESVDGDNDNLYTDEIEIDKFQSIQIEKLQQQASSGIKDFINQKNPYEFQELVAALLRAMNYHTSFIAAKGKDGGIDIIAYQDPLGIQKPRIKVQVKHYHETPIGVEVIRSLKGLINHGEEVGLFVTSGRFSNEAERFAREANVHIKLINGDELISLWQEYYSKLPDEDKGLLPLQAIYFLGGNE
ncbi:MAG: restriction endonuclease [Agriterribacter sp.]